MDNQNKTSNPLSSTQVYLKIGEIRDNYVILKNGGIRAVLKTSSINFNLKSEEEQTAIIYSYQGFLNSLEFPIQILVRSKRLDLDDYINQVKALGEKQTNKLLQEQTYEYAQYIKRLIEYADIMEKSFYVIIPFDTVKVSNSNIFEKFFSRMKPKDTYSDILRRTKDFEEMKKNISQKINVVKSGLENCGLKVEQLDTQALIELFYNCYNPITSRTVKIRDIKNTSIDTDDNIEQDIYKKTDALKA